VIWLERAFYSKLIGQFSGRRERERESVRERE